VVVKIVKPDKWRDLEFRRYFLSKGFITPKKLQNFPHMRYLREWNSLMDSLSTKEAKVVWNTFWKTFKTFKWLSLTDSDRLWNTKWVKATDEWIHLSHDDKKPVVRIGLNGQLSENVERVQLFEEAVEISSNEDGGLDEDAIMKDSGSEIEIVSISSDSDSGSVEMGTEPQIEVIDIELGQLFIKLKDRVKYLFM
jgi:hypothetical protein